MSEKHKDLVDGRKLEKPEPCTDCGSVDWHVADRGPDGEICKCNDCHYYDTKTDTLLPQREKMH